MELLTPRMIRGQSLIPFSLREDWSVSNWIPSTRLWAEPSMNRLQINPIEALRLSQKLRYIYF